MKLIFIQLGRFISVIGLFTLLLNTTKVEAYVSVKGYYKSNGTYVAPHVRSNPNGLKTDNYSYKPSQGIYNKTFGTKDLSWDTSTTITDPDYYKGNLLYLQNKTGTSTSSKLIYPSTIYKAPVLSQKNVSYVTKMWVDNNPSLSCSSSNFLRLKERIECETYKAQKNNYLWNITTEEFNGKHYIYDSVTKITTSCPDGYYATNNTTCALENSNTQASSPLQQGCSSFAGYSVTTGKSCSSGIECGKGLKFNGNMCVK